MNTPSIEEQLISLLTPLIAKLSGTAGGCEVRANICASYEDAPPKFEITAWNNEVGGWARGATIEEVAKAKAEMSPVKKLQKIIDEAAADLEQKRAELAALTKGDAKPE